MNSIEKMKLYLVTDSDILKDRDFYFEIEEALKAGIKCVQLREKNLGGKAFLERAKKLREITKRYDALFIINDRVDIAILSKADGIHVGQSDIPLSDVRELVGKDMIIGVSANTVELAKEARDNGADYIGVGAVFPTSTKKDAKDVGISLLEKIANEVFNIPIVAIGGIKLSKLDMIKHIDIEGYAVISDILGDENIFSKCKVWLNTIN
ncbi:MAG: thiamine phosphate synthase [Sarcina sp.]